ncbi:hypothetical protein Drose_16895 [Dactylosporangium roseum]|uniref:Uncharacterized protein n=1 Tax=Dactylosporangium roseum TaxID=47989 RepID=A0ABY5ZCE6_9ACTN|nr:hypothetical protein [Dactylosporangium roseum]UWZ39744.1 hypothetical protein Drose_16895 [Dactylosporangium roseum]
MSTDIGGQPGTTEIAGLLAWARALSDARSSADPAERAAYQAAKSTLLARLTRHYPDTPGEDPT